MRLARLIDIDDSRFLSSTVAASSLSEYDSGTTYSTGDQVKVSYESDGSTPHRPIEEYESAVDSNTGNYPPDNPSQWTLLGATNRWAMYDRYANTQTEDTESIEVEVDSSDQNVVGLFRLQAKSVTFAQIENKEMMTSPDCTSDDFTVEAGWTYDSTNDQYDCDGSQSGETRLYQVPRIKDKIWYQVEFTVSNYSAGTIAGFVGGTQGTFVSANGTYTQIIAGDGTDEVGVVADADFTGSIDFVSMKKVPNYETKSLENYDVDVSAGWYYYFFYDLVYRDDVRWTFTDYKNAILRVYVEWKSGETVKVGKLALGNLYTIGLTQYNANVGIIDYSKKETDTLGRTYLKTGNFAKRADIDAWLYSSQVDAIGRIIQKARGQPVMIDANNEDKSNYESLVLYCFLRDWDITISGPTLSKLTMDIEGLI